MIAARDLFRTRLPSRLSAHARRLVTAKEKQASAGSSRINETKPRAGSLAACVHASSAGTATITPNSRFHRSSDTIRLARISRGRTGRLSRSSLSFASNSCAFAVNTVPKTISANAATAYIAK